MYKNVQLVFAAGSPFVKTISLPFILSRLANLVMQKWRRKKAFVIDIARILLEWQSSIFL